MYTIKNRWSSPTSTTRCLTRVRNFYLLSISVWFSLFPSPELSVLKITSCKLSWDLRVLFYNARDNAIQRNTIPVQQDYWPFYTPRYARRLKNIDSGDLHDGFNQKTSLHAFHGKSVFWYIFKSKLSNLKILLGIMKEYEGNKKEKWRNMKENKEIIWKPFWALSLYIGSRTPSIETVGLGRIPSFLLLQTQTVG